MVDADINPTSLTGRIVLAPNFSWTWRANLTLLYSLMGYLRDYRWWILIGRRLVNPTFFDS